MKIKKMEIVKGEDNQETLAKTVSFWGLSLTGKICRAVITPAPKNSGLVFMIGRKQIPARFDYLRETSEYTTILKSGTVEIRTAEHLLSALWGLGIDNAIIKLGTNQIPLRDASAESYTRMLQKAGRETQKERRKYLCFKGEMAFRFSQDSKRYAIFRPAKRLKIKAVSIFKNIIGRQEFTHNWSPEVYIRDICWARSFMNSPIFESGGNIWERVRKKIPLLPQIPKFSPIIVYTKDEYITPLKAPNEPVRHKVLDFYGDIALLGIRVLADIKLFKPGHAFTREIVKKIAAKI
jgi:UDP-3-O-acyl-N-acetylglucosamine deacetylase